jgi:hypothetical protein
MCKYLLHSILGELSCSLSLVSDDTAVVTGTNRRSFNLAIHRQREPIFAITLAKLYFPACQQYLALDYR